MKAWCRCTRGWVIGADGYCAICRPSSIVDGASGSDGSTEAPLPRWCRAITYRADDDVITMTILLPTSQGIAPINLEMLPIDAESLATAISRCVDRSHRSGEIVDVDSTPTG